MKAALSVDPIRFPLTGIGRYTYELGRGLQQEALDSLQFLHGYRILSELPRPEEAPPTARPPAWRVHVQKNRLAVETFRRLNPWLKARALKGMEDHVFHGTNYHLPPFGGPSVVTVHDLSLYLWPQSHPPERVKYMQPEIELSLKRASALITDTEYTRQEVAKHFGWPLNRVFAVHLASSSEFTPKPFEILTPILATFGLQPDGYSLFTGTVEPRKNLTTLLDAYSRLPSAMRQRWPLVIAGHHGWGSDALHQRLQQAQQQGWVRYLGFVPDQTLPHLMAGARLFVYPSHYEGFGLPVLEAMASGVPVVCSNASTLPEVTGGVAAMHHPSDTDTLTTLIFSCLQDETWRAKARADGLKQASRFSWQRCTRETLAVYRTISCD